jgi:hypothetical protein
MEPVEKRLGPASVPHLDALVYEQILNGKRKLLYTERAGAVVHQLMLPAYRHEISQGRWPIVGPLPQSEHLIRMVQETGKMFDCGVRGNAIGEANACAQLLLQVFAYAAGRKLDLGGAVVRTHMENCK